VNFSTNGVVELVDDDEPLGGVAGLAGVVEARGDGGLDDRVEVVGASTMNGSEPPSSSTTFFRLPAGDLGDRRAGALRAGHRDALDARVGDDPLDLLVGGVDVDVGALGEAGVVGRSARSPRPTPGTAARA
jgi:hypothetical protein